MCYRKKGLRRYTRPLAHIAYPSAAMRICTVANSTHPSPLYHSPSGFGPFRVTLTCGERRRDGLGGGFALYGDQADGVVRGRQQALHQRPSLGALQGHLRGVRPVGRRVAEDEEVGGRSRGAPRRRHRVPRHLRQVDVGHGPNA